MMIYWRTAVSVMLLCGGLSLNALAAESLDDSEQKALESIEWFKTHYASDPAFSNPAPMTPMRLAQFDIEEMPTHAEKINASAS